MAFQLPPLPDFRVNTPQQPSMLDQYGKMLQLKALQGQQELLPLQKQEAQQRVQTETLANQKEQMALDSQKKLQDAITSGVFNKYAGVDTPDRSGFDAGKAYQDLVANHGVLPDQASAAVNSLLTIAKNQAEIRKTTGQAGEAEQNIRVKTLDQLAQKLGAINEMSLEKAGPALEALKKDIVTNHKAYPGITQQELAELYSADLTHLPAMESLLGLEGKIADFHKSKAEAAKAQQGVINPQTGMSPEQQAEATKEVTVAKAEQPLKIEQAVATARAEAPIKVATAAEEERIRQQIQGMAKPVYAIDSQTGRRVPVSQTEALSNPQRYSLPVPVTENQINEDRQLNNRLADVNMKLKRYEDALNDSGLSSSDKGSLRNLVNQGHLKVGLFGTEIPTNGIDNVVKQLNVGDLSPAGKKVLAAYYNARESMQGYTRVLTGSGRSNEKAMQLNLDALPEPFLDKDTQKEFLSQFKENVGIAGQGLPDFSRFNIKSPEDTAKGTQTQPSNEPPRPTNVPAGYVFKENGPKGRGWYRP